MIAEITKRMIRYFESDTRRISHALKVYGYCKTIGELEAVTPKVLLILEITGLLHDIGIKVAEQKYQSSAGIYQEREGPAVALELLLGLDLDEDILERVSYLIGHHHSYPKIDGIDFQVLVEADFIVNCDEDDMKQEAIETIRGKYFKTETGKALLESMFLRR